MKRGKFIVIDGIDGSGTTTATEGLIAALGDLGIYAIGTFQPSSRPIGASIRGYLRQVEDPIDPKALALLFASDRLDHVHSVIEPALKSGTWVICDRYLMSSWAYQGESCSSSWIREINRFAPWPDMTFVLLIDADLAAQRIDARKRSGSSSESEIFDAVELQRRLAERYSSYTKDVYASGIVAIDATLPPESIVVSILESMRARRLMDP